MATSILLRLRSSSLNLATRLPATGSTAWHPFIQKLGNLDKSFSSKPLGEDSDVIGVDFGSNNSCVEGKSVNEDHVGARNRPSAATIKSGLPVISSYMEELYEYPIISANENRNVIVKLPAQARSTLPLSILSPNPSFYIQPPLSCSDLVLQLDPSKDFIVLLFSIFNFSFYLCFMHLSHGLNLCLPIFIFNSLI